MSYFKLIDFLISNKIQISNFLIFNLCPHLKFDICNLTLITPLSFWYSWVSSFHGREGGNPMKKKYFVSFAYNTLQGIGQRIGDGGLESKVRG